MELNKPPAWLELFQHQIPPSQWFRPVEQIWRQHGWKPPSTECPDTMAKHRAFRTWTHQEGAKR